MRVIGRGVCCGVLLVALGASPVAAGATPPGDGDPGSLVPIPPGCPVPDPADVAFVGTVEAKDYRTVRFRIDQLRAGSAAAWAIDGLIDVRYGSDAQYLDVDRQYLVGAAVDPEIGVLASAVRPPAPLFGGNDVVGVDDTDVECPELDDPVRTLQVDGTDVDTGLLTPLLDERRTLLATIAVPAGIAFAALVGLILLRRVLAWGVRGIFALGRAAVTPAPDHRAVRIREHRVAETAGVASGDGSD